MSKKLNEKVFGEAQLIGQPLRETFILNCAVGEEDGRSMMYVMQTGRPPVFNVMDLNTGELVRSFQLSPETHTCWTHKIDSKGNVYFGAQAMNRLYRYSPQTKQLEELSDLFGEGACYHICFDEEDNVYLGTFPNAKIVKYDVNTNQAVDLGCVLEGEKYAMSMVYHKGWLYVGGNSASTHFVKMNVKTGEIIKLKNPEAVGIYNQYQIRCFYMMTKVGHYIFSNIKIHDGRYVMHVFDLEAEQWLPFTMEKAFGHHVTPAVDGKVYLVLDGELKSFDLNTYEIATTGLKYHNYIMGGGWVTMDDQENYPGLTYATVNYDLGKPVLLNLALKQATVMENCGIIPQPIEIRGMGTDPQKRIITTGYMGVHGAILKKNGFEYFKVGQAEGIGSVGDKVYLGIYTRAQLMELDPSAEYIDDDNPRMIRLLGDKQDRPFKLIDADGMVAIGSVPTYGEFGGALSIYDPKTGECDVYRNVVGNHSVISLAYKDGLIYGSTTVWGGLGIDPTELDGKIFVFDLKTRKKLKEKTIKIEGFGHLMHIGDISFGPDGLLWAVSNGLVFALDPQNLEVVKYKNLNGTDWTIGGIRWVPICIRWGRDGLMYVNPKESVAVFDVDSMEYRMLGGKATHLELDAEDNIYITEYSRLYKINNIK